jgi:hypothetical protein
VGHDVEEDLGEAIDVGLLGGCPGDQLAVVQRECPERREGGRVDVLLDRPVER